MSSRKWLLLFATFFLLGATHNNDNAVHCMALNLYHEARSEDRKSKIAVGWVVLNRAKDGEFPDTICEVIHEGGESPPCEWSWWCDGESDKPQNSNAWAAVQRLARKLLRNPPPDPTEGALWFHHVSIQPPPWAAHSERTVRIGDHVFYRK